MVFFLSRLKGVGNLQCYPFTPWKGRENTMAPVHLCQTLRRLYSYRNTCHQSLKFDLSDIWPCTSCQLDSKCLLNKISQLKIKAFMDTFKAYQENVMSPMMKLDGVVELNHMSRQDNLKAMHTTFPFHAISLRKPYGYKNTCHQSAINVLNF